LLKVLFNLALIIIVGYIIYIKFFKRPTVQGGNTSQKPKNDGSLMVGCDKCGTFVENGDGITKNGKFYCSKECAGER
jgi:uncharacterized protein